MGSQGSSSLFSSSSHFDESRWVRYVRNTLEEEEEEEARIPVTVFSVPKPLLSAKPEAYTPQLFSLGPYHHWQPKLYEMERYKLATAKRTQRQLKTLDLQKLADHFAEHEYIIRSHYHRYLEYTGETLAWLMIIDGSFLLEFLRNYSNIDGKVFTNVPSMSHMVDSARIKLAYNLILRDIVMLENQIPLYVVREILCYQSKTHEIADDQLSKMLIGFVKEASPFKVTENLSRIIDNKQHAHLLQLLYCVIVPKDKIVCESVEIEQHIDMPESKEEITGDPSSVKQIYNWVKGLNISPVRMVKNIVGKPLQFLVKVPWNIISRLPVISVLKGPIESIFAFKGKGKSKDEDSDDTKPPLVEEGFGGAPKGRPLERLQRVPSAVDLDPTPQRRNAGAHTSNARFPVRFAVRGKKKSRLRSKTAPPPLVPAPPFQPSGTLRRCKHSSIAPAPFQPSGTLRRCKPSPPSLLRPFQPSGTLRRCNSFLIAPAPTPADAAIPSPPRSSTHAGILLHGLYITQV